MASDQLNRQLSLVQQARNAWKRGAWNELALMAGPELEAHPERSELAGLLAAAHSSLGNAALADHWARSAVHWGAQFEDIVSLLAESTYNTLAVAAAAAGRHEWAQSLFDKALDDDRRARPGAASARERIETQLGPVGLLLDGGAKRPVGSGNAAGPIGMMLKRLESQGSQIARLRKEIEHVVRVEVQNATRQVEAFSSVQAYLNGSDLVPAMHGWPISPDLAHVLIELVETGDYGLVIEYGSGVSTQIIAKAIARQRERAKDATTVTQVAFEHLQEYHDETARLLEMVGLRESVHLAHSPLKDSLMRDGKKMRFYDVEPYMAASVSKARRSGARLRALILVDGPPASTGPLARLPALAVTLPYLAGFETHILIDDYNRGDERTIVETWTSELRAAGIEPELRELQLEKGAALVKFRA